MRHKTNRIFLTLLINWLFSTVRSPNFQIWAQLSIQPVLQPYHNVNDIADVVNKTKYLLCELVPRQIYNMQIGTRGKNREGAQRLAEFFVQEGICDNAIISLFRAIEDKTFGPYPNEDNADRSHYMEPPCETEELKFLCYDQNVPVPVVGPTNNLAVSQSLPVDCLKIPLSNKIYKKIQRSALWFIRYPMFCCTHKPPVWLNCNNKLQLHLAVPLPLDGQSPPDYKTRLNEDNMAAEIGSVKAVKVDIIPFIELESYVTISSVVRPDPDSRAETVNELCSIPYTEYIKNPLYIVASKFYDAHPQYMRDGTLKHIKILNKWVHKINTSPESSKFRDMRYVLSQYASKLVEVFSNSIIRPVKTLPNIVDSRTEGISHIPFTQLIASASCLDSRNKMGDVFKNAPVTMRREMPSMGLEYAISKLDSVNGIRFEEQAYNTPITTLRRIVLGMPSLNGFWPYTVPRQIYGVSGNFQVKVRHAPGLDPETDPNFRIKPCSIYEIPRPKTYQPLDAENFKIYQENEEAVLLVDTEHEPRISLKLLPPSTRTVVPSTQLSARELVRQPGTSSTPAATYALRLVKQATRTIPKLIEVYIHNTTGEYFPYTDKRDGGEPFITSARIPAEIKDNCYKYVLFPLCEARNLHAVISGMLSLPYRLADSLITAEVPFMSYGADRQPMKYIGYQDRPDCEEIVNKHGLHQFVRDGRITIVDLAKNDRLDGLYVEVSTRELEKFTDIQLLSRFFTQVAKMARDRITAIIGSALQAQLGDITAASDIKMQDIIALTRVDQPDGTQKRIACTLSTTDFDNPQLRSPNSEVFKLYKFLYYILHNSHNEARSYNLADLFSNEPLGFVQNYVANAINGVAQYTRGIQYASLDRPIPLNWHQKLHEYKSIIDAVRLQGTTALADVYGEAVPNEIFLETLQQGYATDEPQFTYLHQMERTVVRAHNWLSKFRGPSDQGEAEPPVSRLVKRMFIDDSSSGTTIIPPNRMLGELLQGVTDTTHVDAIFSSIHSLFVGKRPSYVGELQVCRTLTGGEQITSGVTTMSSTLGPQSITADDSSTESYSKLIVWIHQAYYICKAADAPFLMLFDETYSIKSVKDKLKLFLKPYTQNNAIRLTKQGLDRLDPRNLSEVSLWPPESACRRQNTPVLRTLLDSKIRDPNEVSMLKDNFQVTRLTQLNEVLQLVCATVFGVPRCSSSKIRGMQVVQGTEKKVLKRTPYPNTFKDGIRAMLIPLEHPQGCSSMSQVLASYFNAEGVIGDQRDDIRLEIIRRSAIEYILDAMTKIITGLQQRYQEGTEEGEFKNNVIKCRGVLKNAYLAYRYGAIDNPEGTTGDREYVTKMALDGKTGRIDALIGSRTQARQVQKLKKLGQKAGNLYINYGMVMQGYSPDENTIIPERQRARAARSQQGVPATYDEAYLFYLSPESRQPDRRVIQVYNEYLRPILQNLGMNHTALKDLNCELNSVLSRYYLNYASNNIQLFKVVRQIFGGDAREAMGCLQKGASLDRYITQINDAAHVLQQNKEEKCVIIGSHLLKATMDPITKILHKVTEDMRNFFGQVNVFNAQPVPFGRRRLSMSVEAAASREVKKIHDRLSNYITLYKNTFGDLEQAENNQTIKTAIRRILQLDTVRLPGLISKETAARQQVYALATDIPPYQSYANYVEIIALHKKAIKNLIHIWKISLISLTGWVSDVLELRCGYPYGVFSETDSREQVTNVPSDLTISYSTTGNNILELFQQILPDDLEKIQDDRYDNVAGAQIEEQLTKLHTELDSVKNAVILSLALDQMSIKGQKQNPLISFLKSSGTDSAVGVQSCSRLSSTSTGVQDRAGSVTLTDNNMPRTQNYRRQLYFCKQLVSEGNKVIEKICDPVLKLSVSAADSCQCYLAVLNSLATTMHECLREHMVVDDLLESILVIRGFQQQLDYIIKNSGSNPQLLIATPEVKQHVKSIQLCLKYFGDISKYSSDSTTYVPPLCKIRSSSLNRYIQQLPTIADLAAVAIGMKDEIYLAERRPDVRIIDAYTPFSTALANLCNPQAMAKFISNSQKVKQFLDSSRKVEPNVGLLLNSATCNYQHTFVFQNYRQAIKERYSSSMVDKKTVIAKQLSKKYLRILPQIESTCIPGMDACVSLQTTLYNIINNEDSNEIAKNVGILIYPKIAAIHGDLDEIFKHSRQDVQNKSDRLAELLLFSTAAKWAGEIQPVLQIGIDAIDSKKRLISVSKGVAKKANSILDTITEIHSVDNPYAKMFVGTYLDTIRDTAKNLVSLSTRVQEIDYEFNEKVQQYTRELKQEERDEQFGTRVKELLDVRRYLIINQRRVIETATLCGIEIDETASDRFTQLQQLSEDLEQEGTTERIQIPYFGRLREESQNKRKIIQQAIRQQQLIKSGVQILQV